MSTYALAAGEVTGGVTDDVGGILSKVYHDPITDEYYMIALNMNGSGYNPTFDFSSLPGNWVQAYSIDGNFYVGLTSEQFTRYFAPYQVQTYRLIHAPEPAMLALVLSGLGVLLLARSRYSKSKI